MKNERVSLPRTCAETGTAVAGAVASIARTIMDPLQTARNQHTGCSIEWHSSRAAAERFGFLQLDKTTDTCT